MKNIYSIRKTTLGVGSVLIGSLLFMGQEAMAQEVSVLPESEVSETNVLSDDEVEENAVFEDEEIVTNVVNEVLPPVEVDAESTSPFTFVKGDARIIRHYDEHSSTKAGSIVDILKLDITFKVPNDINYRSQYAFNLTMPVVSNDNILEDTGVRIRHSSSNAKVDLKIRDTIVGKLENGVISFNEKLNNFKDREVAVSAEISINPIYVESAQYDGKINLPLDVKLNKYHIHRFNVERDPIFDNEEKEKGVYAVTSISGSARDDAPNQDPLRLTISHAFGGDDLKKEGRITYDLPEGLVFESDQGDLKLKPIAHSLTLTHKVQNFLDYKLLESRDDGIEYTIESITPQALLN